MGANCRPSSDKDAILRTRVVYWLPVTYLVGGIAWITGSDYLLGRLFRDDPNALLFAGSLKGVLFVSVTALLLFVALYLRVGVAPAGRMAERSAVETRAWKPLVIFLVAAVGIGAAGVSLYATQAGEIRRNRAAELRSVAGLKATQIEYWLEDRRKALEQVAASPFLREALEEWLAGREPEAGPRLETRIQGVRHAHDFAAVQILGADGERLAGAGESFEPTAELRAAMRSAARAAAAVSTGLYFARDPTGSRAVMDQVVALRAPARETRRLLGFIVARSDPEQFLIPLVKAWPLAETSGESLLLQRQGDEVVALGGIRESGAAPVTQRWPLARRDLASVRAVLGERDTIQGNDHRGVPVLAVGVPVVGTDWFLLAKVDLSDVHAPLLRILLMASVLVAAALVAAAALIVLWWRREELRMGLALARSEQRASALVQHFAWASRLANDMVVLCDEEGTILEVNDRASETYGYSREELIGRSLFEVELRDAGGGGEAEVRRDFEAILAAGQRRFEAVHRRKDGRPLPVEISSRCMDVGGRRYVQSIMRDITERRVHEQRIAEISAERDRLLKRLELQFERMPMGCVVSGPDWRVLQINAAFERIFGYSREELDRDDAWELIVPAEVRDWLLAQMAPLATGDATLTLVNENLTKAGPRITCRWTNTPLHGPAGEFLGIVGMCEDITQQIATERALRSSEARFRALAEVAPAVVFRIDSEGRCTYVNSRWREFAGTEPSAAFGLGWVDSVHPDDRDALAKARQSALATGNFRMEFRLVRPDRSAAWVLVLATREFGADGLPTGFVGMVTDITDLKATELELQESRNRLEERVRQRTRELEAAKERAEQADRVKSRFLSTMSHELRTPLNSILGFTDVLLEGLSGPLNEEQRRHLGIVRDSSDHLLGLINDLLDLSRIEAGQLRVEIANVDLPELLRRRVQAFEAEAARKGLALAAAVGAGVGVIRSDAQRVAQIVDNLLSNALKFTETGSVALAACVAGDRVEVEVRDTGPGIDPQYLPMLFEPFFTRAVGAAGRSYEGIGLGLPIAHHLAQALGGTIAVASRPGEGSSFTLSLPVAGPQPA